MIQWLYMFCMRSLAEKRREIYSKVKCLHSTQIWTAMAWKYLTTQATKKKKTVFNSDREKKRERQQAYLPHGLNWHGLEDMLSATDAHTEATASTGNVPVIAQHLYHHTAGRNRGTVITSSDTSNSFVQPHELSAPPLFIFTELR